MKAYPSDLYELSKALENAASDLFSFVVVCMNGAVKLANPLLQDILLLALEKAWITEDFGSYTHKDFREDLFREVWLSTASASKQIVLGTDVPLGHNEMRFYQLSALSRAALFLRTKKKFSYTSLSFILDQDPLTLRTEVEKARTYILGREIKEFSEY